jgi:hypothetical protein
VSSSFLPFQKKLFHEILLNLVVEDETSKLLPKLANNIFVTSFYSWMSKGAHNIFAQVSLNSWDFIGNLNK